jgi:YVTN family beta-propeller protein
MHAYVTNFADGTVSVLATATNMVVATIPVGFHPQGVAITPSPLDSQVRQ